MSFILNIDTTSETAVINIAADGVVLEQIDNDLQRDHALFLHTGIQLLLQKLKLQMADMAAVAVSHGPGSYTGIRVGVAAAKGLCYASEKPLILVSQLEILAQDAVLVKPLPALYCPMIDARRMEVFTAIYDANLTLQEEPHALILDEHSFTNILEKQPVIFCGNGAGKWQQVCIHENAHFIQTINKGLSFAMLSVKKFSEKNFSDVAYSTPLYIKDFHVQTSVR